MLYLMGHVVNENEMIWFIVNNGSPQMREEVEPVANDFLSRNFNEGVKGNLYRIDDEWWFTDGWSRANRNADWRYKGTDNPGRYRSEWMKRTNEWEDDYSALINLFRTVSKTYKQEQIERLVDPHQTMIMSMVRGYISDWDSFSLTRGKNGYFYQRHNDGKFQFLHWDSDLAFGNTGSKLYSGMPGFSGYISKWYNKRLFYSYLAEFYEKYTYDSPRMYAWLDAEEAVSSSYSSRASEFKSFFSNRRGTCKSELGTNYSRKKFEITTNKGNDWDVTADSVSLKGTSPYGIIHLEVEGHPEAQAAWIGLTGWQVAGIQLREGEQTVKLLGKDQNGNIRNETEIKINKSGNAAPVASLKSRPASWNISVDDTLDLDARDSYDPEGQALTYAWSATSLEEIDLRPLGQARAKALFSRPGLYSFTVKVTDEGGNESEVVREAAVHGTTGFSGFGDPALEDYWRSSNVRPRGNFSPATWYSLDDVPGWLELQVLDYMAKPLAKSISSYPFISRKLPEKNDWALQTKMRLVSRQFGDYDCGLMVLMNNGTKRMRYTIGFEDGVRLAVKKVDSKGNANSLYTKPVAQEEMTVRIIRHGDKLLFEWKVEDVWEEVHAETIEVNTPAYDGGMFVATEEVQAIRVGFDYAILIDPAAVSPLKGSLRVSEIMYNPIGGDDYEYIELINAGASTINLNGAQIDRGVTYQFGKVTLGAGERIVVAKNQSAFQSRYGKTGIRLADGQYEGRLRNNGETVAVIDADGDLVFEVDYEDGGAWPGRADGNGSSLVVVNPLGDLSDPRNWNSSNAYNGTPGGAVRAVPTIVVNELLTHSDAPQEDAIELYNHGKIEVDISGWFLSDSSNNLKKYRIPDGTKIVPNGYHVFYEKAFLLDNGENGFSLSSARGDEVWLTEANSEGNLLRFVDKVEFGPAANGVTFGRYPNATGPLVTMANNSLGSDVKAGQDAGLLNQFRAGKGAPNTGPLVGPVVISEIMYAPEEGNAEYVVLSNTSVGSVPLFDPANPLNGWKLDNAIEFKFPTDFILKSGESVYIGSVEPGLLREQYEFDADTLILGPFEGKLNNAGESLQLFRPDSPQTLPPDIGLIPYILVEKVKYGVSSPWPSMPKQGGVSIQRVSLDRFGNNASNWMRFGTETDSDRDGMPDGWEDAHALDPNDAADGAFDPDSDGLANVVEYVAGTDPRDAGSSLTLNVLRLEDGRFRLGFVAVEGRSYTIHTSQALGQAWQPLAEFAPKAAGVVTHELPPSGGQRYFRLEVVLNP